MTKLKSPAKFSCRGTPHGKQYPGIHGKIVDWTDHAFAECILYIRVRSQTEPNCVGGLLIALYTPGTRIRNTLGQVP